MPPSHNLGCLERPACRPAGLDQRDHASLYAAVYGLNRPDLAAISAWAVGAHRDFWGWSRTEPRAPSLFGVTTTLDRGSAPRPAMLRCPLRADHLYPTLVLAMRDMRTAHHRDPDTGDGDGTESWIGLTLGMIVLDTLSGSSPNVRQRWVEFLTANGIPEHDAAIIYAVRNALLHGYGPPTNLDKTSGRKVVFTDDPHGYAVDTTQPGLAVISVPVFCSRLVERIATAAPDSWDVSEVDTALADPDVTDGGEPAPALVERPAPPKYASLDLASLDLDDIATALQDQHDYEHRWLINPETGQIAYWTAECGIDGQHPVDLDDLDMLCIDPLPSHVWYQDMEDFADQISDERAGRRLLRAIQGRGAFRRFKDELHDEYPHLVQAWYAFRDTRAQRRAVQWLADNELVGPQIASLFYAEHPDPDLP